jgi:GTP-binding protein EngB required for normal cell division|tara:strand:+ start:25 stop:435 length:411 start_codon:yes stop_codon:yes gene_type:complete
MTKIKATNKEMLDTLHGLYAVQDLKGVKFAVAVSKNIERLKNELKHIDEASKPSPEFQKLMTEADKIEKDEKAEELLMKLESENQELIDKRKAQLEEVNELLEEDIEIDLITMSEHNLPQDITAKQLGAIIRIVNN